MEELIIECSRQEVIENLDKIITESIKKIVPKSTDSYISKRSNRKKMLEKFGEKAFLDPDKLAFPVMNKNGKYDCGLIYAARARALQWKGKKPGYQEIADKAEELYKEHNCSKKTHLKIHDIKENLELLDLLQNIL